MISAIISAIAAAFKLAATWLGYARDKLLIALGAERQKSMDLQGRINALQEANKIREAERARLERNPDGVVQRDAFTRDGDD